MTTTCCVIAQKSAVLVFLYIFKTFVSFSLLVIEQVAIVTAVNFQKLNIQLN